MGLTGAENHTVIHCLLNGLAKDILELKRKAQYSFPDAIDYETDEGYINKCKQIEINHIFDMGAFIKENPYFDHSIELGDWSHDIRKEERIFQKTIERDEVEISKIYGQVTKCREYMNKNLYNINNL